MTALIDLVKLLKVIDNFSITSFVFELLLDVCLNFSN